jgi:hypothetical protein
MLESPDFIREEQARSKTPEAGGSGGGGDKERATIVTSEGGVVMQ